MPIPQVPSPLTAILATGTYDVNWFQGSTIEQQVQAAINAAAADGAPRVLVHGPYDASQITFNTAVQMVIEGGDWSVYDVRAYGAVGDGIQNNQVAVQAALTAAASSSNNKEVVLVPGTYAIGSTLSLPINNTRVVLLRGSTSRTGTSNTGGAILKKTFDGTLFEQVGQESVAGHTTGIRIRDLVLDGGGHTGSLLDFRGIINHVHLDRVAFTNNLGRAIFGRAIENAHIRFCSILRCGTAGIPAAELNVSDPTYSVIGSQTNGVWCVGNHWELNNGTDLLITNTQRNTSACVNISVIGGKFEMSAPVAHPAVVIEAGWDVLLDTFWGSGDSGAAAHAVDLVGNSSFTNFNITVRGQINYNAVADATSPDYNIYVTRVNGLSIGCQMQGARVANIYMDQTSGLIWRASVSPSCTFGGLRPGGVAIGGPTTPHIGLGALRTQGNADVSVNFSQSGAERHRFTTALTANRTVTLATDPSIPLGQTCHIARPATGAFNLDVGPGVKTLAAGQWCTVVYDGAAWQLLAFGSL